MLLQKWLKDIEDIQFLGTDINPEALKIAAEVASANLKKNTNISFLKTNLLEDVDSPIDVLIFNPVFFKITIALCAHYSWGIFKSSNEGRCVSSMGRRQGWPISIVPAARLAEGDTNKLHLE